MSSVKKVLLFVISLAMLVIFSVPVYAFDAENFQRYGNPYYLQSYDVQIVVTEDNTLNITEQITAFFFQSRHGIYRNIPLSNSVKRADGTVGTTHARVRSLSVSEQYNTSIENGDYVIQIGSEDATVKGEHNYTISYSYVMGQDIGEGFDELYYNIIGNGWDAYIENVTFSIIMPKEFDVSKLGFSTGAYGTTGTSDIEYYVDGNEINGRLTKTLAPGEAFTVRLELPDGYFYFNLAAYYTRLAFMVIIPIAALICVILLWNKFGRDKKLIDIVEFYPPEGMSSLDVAYWYKGIATNQDTIPLMIELANEGYIKINQYEIKSIFHKGTGFMIEFGKMYNGSDKCKKIFFDGLFKSGKTKVYEKDLENKFYASINQILTSINTIENRKKVFNNKSLYMRLLGWAISILSAVLAVLIFMGTIGGFEKYLALIAGIAVSVISFIFAFFIRQRTVQGHLMLQKIKGFKKFLETAEKERLETLVYDNPTYYYDILPYAYVLGVSDAWTRNFEGITMEPPQWYYGGVFNRMVFWSFMNSTMESAAKTMSSSPQSTGGFSGGGGGFSGGGSGGGGGGS